MAYLKLLDDDSLHNRPLANFTLRVSPRQEIGRLPESSKMVKRSDMACLIGR
jgi:hypothetical protein